MWVGSGTTHFKQLCVCLFRSIFFLNKILHGDKSLFPMRQNLVLVKVLEKIGTVWLRLQFLGLVLIKTEEDVYLFVQEQVCESAERGNKTELTRRSRLTRTRGAVRRHFGEICLFFFLSEIQLRRETTFSGSAQKKKKVRCCCCTKLLLLPGDMQLHFCKPFGGRVLPGAGYCVNPSQKTAQVDMHH